MQPAGMVALGAGPGRLMVQPSTTDVMLAGNWKTSRMVAHCPRRCVPPVTSSSAGDRGTMFLLGSEGDMRRQV